MKQKRPGNKPIRATVKRNWRRDEQTPVLFPEISDTPWLTSLSAQFEPVDA
jgi:hypothetical protein